MWGSRFHNLQNKPFFRYIHNGNSVQPGYLAMHHSSVFFHSCTICGRALAFFNITLGCLYYYNGPSMQGHKHSSTYQPYTLYRSPMMMYNVHCTPMYNDVVWVQWCGLIIDKCIHIKIIPADPCNNSWYLGG